MAVNAIAAFPVKEGLKRENYEPYETDHPIAIAAFPVKEGLKLGVRKCGHWWDYCHCGISSKRRIETA